MHTSVHLVLLNITKMEMFAVLVNRHVALGLQKLRLVQLHLIEFVLQMCVLVRTVFKDNSNKKNGSSSSSSSKEKWNKFDDQSVTEWDIDRLLKTDTYGGSSEDVSLSTSGTYSITESQKNLNLPRPSDIHLMSISNVTDEQTMAGISSSTFFFTSAVMWVANLYSYRYRMQLFLGLNTFVALVPIFFLLRRYKANCCIRVISGFFFNMPFSAL